MMRSSPEEEESGRDAALAATIVREEPEAPKAKDHAGPDKPLEDSQREEENGQESPKVPKRSPASLQGKDPVKQPSHVPGGACLHKARSYLEEGRATAERYITGPEEGQEINLNNEL
ncbi:hypothetical protein NDU88_003206 [Pleurodeles waltl]|uniref:Uncharacterized protein n=1 Tax=Pleurodeles waltl TaxID=8319 RepID=A0AAV7VCQ2_PLEWA|nr:hypothetical protein NDU88_003206 [Pleurodeles waltl]